MEVSTMEKKKSKSKGSSPKGPIMHLADGDKRLNIVEGIEFLLDEMTEEVLRYQPEDIYDFLAKYFEKKRTKRNEGRKSWEFRTYSWDGPSILNPDELAEFLATFNINSETAHKYATKIEAAFRGHLVRLGLEKKGKRLHKDHRKSWEWKRWSWEGPSVLTEDQLMEFLQEHDINLEAANKYATKIQSVYRGHVVRRSLDNTNTTKKKMSNQEDTTTDPLIQSPPRRKTMENFLPYSATPVHYDILIKPDMKTFTFLGTEFIRLKINRPTSSITMNAKELKIINAVWRASCMEQKTEAIEVDDSAEILRLYFKPKLQKGCGILYLHFNGQINENPKGFYRLPYKTQNGEIKYNALTQFEAAESRRVFPVFDDPGRKSTFDISLIVEKNQIALSNMPVKEIRPFPKDDNLNFVKFHISPVMSTYLLSYIIGDFEYIEAISSDDIVCRVYTQPGKKTQGDFALRLAAQLLTYYNAYFQVEYPLPKLDLVAISDFSYNSTSSWGLLTFHESFLLVDEEHSTTRNRQNIALTIAHEISHQWVANLVTTEWWTELWLNEGFATFLENLSIDYIFPSYHIWTQFVTDKLMPALELDALQNSHPIQVVIKKPAEIEQIFHDISFDKAACVIRMLHHYIGDMEFRSGMNTYLNKHRYKNSVAEDMWVALEESSQKPVSAIMNSWVNQTGFPLIRVYAPEEADKTEEGIVVHLTQEKFCANPTLKEQNPEEKEGISSEWVIPLAFCSSSKPVTRTSEILMESESVTVTLPGIQNDTWVKLNPGCIGFYRVCYPPDMFEKFYAAVRAKQLTPMDRIGLLDDLFAMVKAGESPTTALLQFLEAFREEENFTVWSCISKIITKFCQLLSHTEYYGDFLSYARFLYDVVAENVGWDIEEGESHVEKVMLRPLVLSQMVSLGHEGTIDESADRLDRHLTGENIILADLRFAVYKAVLSVGGEIILENMKIRYKWANSPEEKDRIANALGAVSSPELLKDVLEFSKSPDVRPQDSMSIISAVGQMSKEGRQLAWDFFKENKSFLQERYQGTSGGLISRLVKDITENFITEEAAVEVEEFFKANPLPGTDRVVQQVVENIRINEAWLKRDQIPVEDFLTSIGVTSFNLSHLMNFSN